MTFKHVKFEDSAVMRSLEKLAKEKGLVPSESFTKKASTVEELDLAPTDNLMQNVLNLCEGLRRSGLEKQANELEQKFLVYKKAQTLYEAFSEKGEDLIDAAHPKGSHKLEDVDSEEAVFETILDQHLQNVKMIEKNPTGKLASSKNILSAVKTVLGQGAPDLGKVTELTAEAAKLIEQINQMTKDELTFSISPWVSRANTAAGNPTVYNLNAFRNSLDTLLNRLDPSFSAKWNQLGIGGVSDYTWSRVQGIISKARTTISEAIMLRTKIDSAETAALEGRNNPGAAAKPEADPSAQAVQGARQALNDIKFVVQSDTDADKEDKDAVTNWINNKIEPALKSLETNYKSMSPEAVQIAVRNITKNFATVKQQWT